jgi:glutathione S-transferase
MASLIFYLSPGASSMAPHIALHEVGETFESRVVSLKQKREARPAEFLALNPEGKVPTLVADGTVLTEVAAILYWLARRHPEANLWPAGDLAAETRAISWMSFIAATVHPARARGLDYAMQIFGIADQRLGKHDWALGARYSIADIHLFRLYWRFANALKPPVGSLPNLEAHHERMMARPAVRKTIEIETAIGYDLP